MELCDALRARRSTRAFTDRPVSRAEAEALLNAAILAPSACNMQSWHFYAVMDPDVRARFSEVCAPWACAAPVIFVVCADQTALRERFGSRWDDGRIRTFVIQDTALAAENLLLTAADMGLGGCFMGAFDAAKCRELLSIPERYEIVALIPVGEPAEQTPPKERKPLSEVADIIGGDPACDPDGGEKSDGDDCGEPLVIRDCDNPAGVVFENNSVPGSVFKSGNMPCSLFDDLNLAGARFSNVNLSGASFEDINLSGASYGGLTMASSRFGCVDFNNAEFENPCFDGAVFKNCSFKNVRFEDCEFDAIIVDKDGTETKLK